MRSAKGSSMVQQWQMQVGETQLWDKVMEELKGDQEKRKNQGIVQLSHLLWSLTQCQCYAIQGSVTKLFLTSDHPQKTAKSILSMLLYHNQTQISVNSVVVPGFYNISAIRLPSKTKGLLFYVFVGSQSESFFFVSRRSRWLILKSGFAEGCCLLKRSQALTMSPDVAKFLSLCTPSQRHLFKLSSTTTPWRSCVILASEC